MIHGKKLYFTIISVLYVYTGLVECRSIHRPAEPWLPTINVCWADDPSRTYTLCNANLQESTYFNLFDINFFYNHLLKDSTALSYRYEPDTTIHGKLLNEQIELLLQEIKYKKRAILTLLSFKIPILIIAKHVDYSYSNLMSSLLFLNSL